MLGLDVLVALGEGEVGRAFTHQAEAYFADLLVYEFWHVD